MEKRFDFTPRAMANDVLIIGKMGHVGGEIINKWNVWIFLLFYEKRNTFLLFMGVASKAISVHLFRTSFVSLANRETGEMGRTQWSIPLPIRSGIAFVLLRLENFVVLFLGCLKIYCYLFAYFVWGRIWPTSLEVVLPTLCRDISF